MATKESPSYESKFRLHILPELGELTPRPDRSGPGEAVRGASGEENAFPSREGQEQRRNRQDGHHRESR
jgi:hypothetical protein